MTVALALVALASAGPIFQEQDMSGQYGYPVFRTEIPNMERFAGTASEQQMSQWCWAASVSNVFAYHGHPLAQEKIVTEVYGGLVNLPSFTARRIAQQLNRNWTDDDGVEFKARLTSAYDSAAGVYLTNNEILKNEIRAGRPVVIGTTHCMVVTAIDSAEDGRVVGAGLYDPWPGQGFRMARPEEILAVELGGKMTFLATVRVEAVGQRSETRVRAGVR
ncbi:MAG: C39 family peptidase [Fimbriimonadaceae bacterium]|nr:C39 family peptidase [Fimbriimonadaceae bacterium]QYK58720.1 MAG: C39 family peptidase [Fimbriimonadaceae bacterium]